MAGLRKFQGYRKLERPYTRKSKYKKKNFIRAMPAHKIIRFEMGDKTKMYDSIVKLVSKEALQIRHNAIESTRQIVNRHLQKYLGGDYFFQINMYPHHGLRENKMLGGAHADRIQTGMGHPFGKVVSMAAQIHRGKTVLTTYVNKGNVEKAKEALQKAFPRLPGRYVIVVDEHKKKLS